MVIRCPLSTVWKWQLVLYASLRWRQGRLISEMPCSECTIHNIHKSIWQTIFFSFFSHDTHWTGQPAILYHRENEKLKWGFSINWETHLLLQAFYFSKCLVNFDASVMTLPNTLEFSAQCFMYSYSLPLRIQWWVLFCFCSSLPFLFVCPHVSWALVFGEHLSWLQVYSGTHQVKMACTLYFGSSTGCKWVWRLDLSLGGCSLILWITSNSGSK
jgi:hypothetical protein